MCASVGGRDLGWEFGENGDDVKLYMCKIVTPRGAINSFIHSFTLI